jgi:hypothetical protein
VKPKRSGTFVGSKSATILVKKQKSLRYQSFSGKSQREKFIDNRLKVTTQDSRATDQLEEVNDNLHRSKTGAVLGRFDFEDLDELKKRFNPDDLYNLDGVGTQLIIPKKTIS